jgi:hypothetical protein
VVFSLGSVPRVYLNKMWLGARMVVRVYWGVGGDTDKETFKMPLHTGQLRVSKCCESEMATKDTHLVL